MTVVDVSTVSLTEAAGLIKNQEISPVELTQAMLSRISRLDHRLHSYLTVSAEAASEQARAAEQEIVRGHYRGPLHGIPIAAKDLICTKGIRTTCGSKIFADWVPDHDATVVKKLYSAGAILLGKLSMTEFAGIGYHPSIPLPINPWDADRWPGSSSSGSAVATAASLCFGSIGTDTGGSIRFPSAACGIVGLKPTYGRVSRSGVFPLAESLDHVGPMTRCVSDAAVLLGAMAGFDAQDPTTMRAQVPDYLKTLTDGVKKIRIGLDEAYCLSGVEPEVASAVRGAVQVLRDLGADVRDVKFSGAEDAIAAWSTIFTAEIAATHEQTYPSRADDYGPSFRAFLQESGQVRGLDYAKAHATRQQVCRLFDDLWQEVDLFVCPTMARLPVALGGRTFEEVISPERAHELLIFTSPFSLTGSPTISLPCGLSSGGLPISLQLVGRHAEEGQLLQVGYAYEQATEWHERRPSVSNSSPESVNRPS